jgi:hypothetical protein
VSPSICDAGPKARGQSIGSFENLLRHPAAGQEWTAALRARLPVPEIKRVQPDFRQRLAAERAGGGEAMPEFGRGGKATAAIIGSRVKKIRWSRVVGETEAIG